MGLIAVTLLTLAQFAVEWSYATSKITSALSKGPFHTRNQHEELAPYFMRIKKNLHIERRHRRTEKDGCICGIANTPWKKAPQKGNVSGLRIVGGADAMKHKYPWLVRILMKVDPWRINQCGGSLVNEVYVLTAGHCTNKATCASPYRPEDLTVTVAEHNVYSINDDVKATKKYTVKEVIRHEQYCLQTNTNKFNHDIALLKLSQAVDLSSNEAGIICLPPHPKAEYENEYVTLAGWGFTSKYGPRGGSVAKILQEVNITTNDCSAYPKASHITENMICAGDLTNTKDACGGDSGGPLMAFSPVSDKYIQIGAVSFGPPGGNCIGIGAYTKVAHYIDWIKIKTQDAKCQDNIAPSPSYFFSFT